MGKFHGRDDAHHAERLPGHRHLEARADRVDHLTGVAQGLTAVELQDLPGPHHLAPGLGQRLALLAGQQVAELIGSPQHLVTGPVEDVGTLLRCGESPAGQRLPGRADCRFSIGASPCAYSAMTSVVSLGLTFGVQLSPATAAPPMTLGRRRCPLLAVMLRA